jgi:oxygen-independent coproporphyrinogen-3 oxidase
LPNVKKWEIRNDIEFILDNYDFIKHISVYMLEEYYDIPEDIDSKFENIIYPNNWNEIWIKDEDYLWEYMEVKEFLKSRGFNSYEISNFAKPWFECKHNKAYWDHSNILAFWLWAHWFINNERYSNSEEFIKYYSWKIDNIEKLSPEDIFLEKVMFQLRTSWLNEEIYNKLDSENIEYFIKNWYLEKKSNKIILLDKWILVMDYILSEII